ncbi:XRE family transcriptional regulator [Terrimonas sp.]|uniref:helix-turn-helix domain-containing protein n=1 Tax=Terrimonas sp. TaxID=1914338 RepID=UPI000D51D48A|nr:helix-turn-helix transcriptional regulator [Terrimonas sp.]PVD53260.1 XRE family transcriptional regulator [Terrimonas sp.]
MTKISKEDNVFLKALGKRIRDIRKEKGFTQVELGDMIDMEKPNMNRLEKGGTNPTILTLKKICIALGITLDYLLLGLQQND